MNRRSPVASGAEAKSCARKASTARTRLDYSTERGPIFELLLGLLCVVSILVSTTFRLNDADVWEHLAVGRALWAICSIPTTQVWTWPTFGAAYLTPSWGFRLLLWPWWRLGGLSGVFLLRWLLTLATYGVTWLVARRLGVRGIAIFAVIALGALAHRFRTQLRPEMLADLLLMLEVWILERRRTGLVGGVRWLPLIAWVWVNCHISYYLFFAILFAYWLDDLRSRVATLPLVALISLTLGLLNPYGWRTLAQPFEYFFVWQHEPIFRAIGELHRIDWEFNRLNGLGPLMIAWPLLAGWSWFRRGVDIVELLLMLGFTPLALVSQRFVGTWSVICCPFIARALRDVLADVVLPRPLASRAMGAFACCFVLFVVPLPEWSRPELRPGVGVDELSVPRGACDFIERNGIRGRFFNHFELGGYMLWRFGEGRDRLPFMDIHQSGGDEELRSYVGAMARPEGCPRLRDEYAIDVAVLKRLHARGDHLLNSLDADTSFALVFLDDVAAVYLKRTPSRQAFIAEHAYTIVGAGDERLATNESRISREVRTRRQFALELMRVARESSESSSANTILATMALQERNADAAVWLLDQAHGVDPLLPLYHSRRAEALGMRGDLPAARTELGMALRAREITPQAFDARRAELDAR